MLAIKALRHVSITRLLDNLYEITRLIKFTNLLVSNFSHVVCECIRFLKIKTGIQGYFSCLLVRCSMVLISVLKDVRYLQMLEENSLY